MIVMEDRSGVLTGDLLRSIPDGDAGYRDGRVAEGREVEQMVEVVRLGGERAPFGEAEREGGEGVDLEGGDVGEVC